MDKIIIALLSSIIALTIKEIIDQSKERKRIKNVRIGLKSFINDSIIKTLKLQITQYETLKELIISGQILIGGNLTQYPWLNSKILDFFTKSDMFKILNKVGNNELSIMYRKFVELDFVSDNSPMKIYTQFDTFLREHFKEEELITKKQKENHYNDGQCPVIEVHKKNHSANIDKRIKQSENLIKYFETLNTKLK